MLDRVGILILRLVVSNPLSRFQQRETARFHGGGEGITANEAWNVEKRKSENIGGVGVSKGIYFPSTVDRRYGLR